MNEILSCPYRKFHPGMKISDEAKKVAEKRRTEVVALVKCLHREFELIPFKAMRKERSEHYRSASELADDIENYLKGAPLIAGPQGTGYKLKKFVRRNRVLVGGIAAVLFVLVAGVVVSTIFAIGQARALAEAERQAKISQAVSAFLREDLLASVDPTKAKGRELTVRSFLDTASENLMGKFENEPLVEASIRDTLGWTYQMLGEIKAAEPHLERALRIREEQLGQKHPETLNSMGRLGWIYCDQGRYNESESLYLKTLEIQRRVLGEKHVYTLWSTEGLARLYTRQGKEQAQYEKAEPLLREAVKGRRLKLGDIHPHTQQSLNNLIDLYEAWGKPEKAEEWRVKLPQTEAVEH